ncbi:hypothetical protein [Adlercreutzia sp. ZJ304]|uniref:hypothetical protein n=1 Tax=Adlercreutzia sp. ZJ304 TaxID=2709791 RepID=UPI0013EDF83D|nr:hypothetical protein [Adlercreutzia sp. ZJ304]
MTKAKSSEMLVDAKQKADSIVSDAKKESSELEIANEEKKQELKETESQIEGLHSFKQDYDKLDEGFDNFVQIINKTIAAKNKAVQQFLKLLHQFLRNTVYKEIVKQQQREQVNRVDSSFDSQFQDRREFRE